MTPHGRPYIASDNIGRCCNCLACQAAEITDRPVVRVPGDSELGTRTHWAHGEELKAWYVAKESFDLHLAKLTATRGVE